MMSGIIDLRNLDTTPGGAGNFAPPADWSGDVDEYIQAMRQRWQHDPGWRQQVIISARMMQKEPNNYQCSGPLAREAADLLRKILKGFNSRLAHHCHAKGCTLEVAPKLLMCRNHWRKVPKALQSRVWQHYRPGQEQDKNPTPEYLQAADAAIKAVASKSPSQVRTRAIGQQHLGELHQRFKKTA